MSKLVSSFSSVLILGLSLFVIQPAEASGTNCWVGWRNTMVANAYQGKALVIGRCNKAIFELINSETERNIRKAPTINSPVIGKLTNSDTNNYFLADIIVTIDNGRTYWAYGTVVSSSKSIYSESIRSDAVMSGLKGWVEVGNTDVIRQYDRPDSNDVWFKLQ
jgi:hypothetical protein